MQSFSASVALVEFSFESRLAADVDEALLRQLARQAWRNNLRLDLTGEMWVAGCRVRQVIEGDVDAVLPLVSRILTDRRHGSIRVLAFRPLAARRHPEWRVRGVGLPRHPVPELVVAGGTVVPFRPRPAAQGAEPALLPGHCSLAL